MKTALLICLTFSGIIFSQTQKAQKIQAVFEKAAANGLFNGNVLVVDHHQVVYKKAIGYTDAHKNTPLTSDYRFHIGSIAKEFNAVGIMLLQDRGKLKLTDNVSQYLPELPAWSKSITIRDLLGYTSGIPDIQWKSVKSDQENMVNLIKTEKLDFEPGTQYAYNNNNVFLQRRIIERITGLSFNDFVYKELLIPNKITHAVIDPTEKEPLVARAFDDKGQQDPMDLPISGWTAVNLDDFYQWSQSIVNFKIISPESTRFLLIPYSPSKQSGLGSKGQMAGNKIIHYEHDGTARNYQALLVCSPEEGRAIILMTNNKQNNLFDFNTAIQNILDGKPYKQIKKQVMPLLQNDIDQLHGKEIITRYLQLKKQYQDSYAFDSEDSLNTLGYYLLNKKRTDDAIEVLQYNTRLFPKSGNVFDSLGEAYLTKGDQHNALKNYKRAVALDPANENAKNIINKIERKED
ncbi:serine hydrolase [Elizabethkingia anophelis]|uniref:serine hydrolase n=1 Tax=Elizabethkingia anophelis TaxID=1117645 RepID=UPI00293CB84F|nr:serine hydrolase [Elizabethkingia anophelis]MDV3541539.1 serine hydrolase [Elizabethkingia anophelis]